MISSSPLICPWCCQDVTPDPNDAQVWTGHLPTCPSNMVEPDLEAAAALPQGELQTQQEACISAYTPPEEM